MKELKKIFCIILTIAMLSTLSSCSKTGGSLFGLNTDNTESEQAVAQLSSLTLPADYSDSFNPFKATTVSNRYIFPLMYDSLYKLDEHFKPQKCIASKYTRDDTEYRIAIKSNIKFSDGSKLTGYDVEYSLNKAISSSLYSAQLENIDYIEAGKTAVKIVLKHPDINFLNCLDTPIVKLDTADSSKAPIGSGRYIFDDESNSYTLGYNEDYFDKTTTPNFKTITLNEIPDAEAIMTSVKTGQVHAMFSDLRDGEIGGVDANTVPVSLNNMLYIGINAKGILSEADARRAISFALNRSTILSKGYSSRGTATYLPINPLFDYGKDIKVPSYNINKATTLLEDLGYTKTNLNGTRLKNNKKLSIRLLINSDNNYKVLTATAIKSALQTVGIEVIIDNAKNITALQKKLSAGNFDLYLGETRLHNNMDISDFFSGSILGKGISDKDTLKDAYEKYQKTGDITDFSKTFFKNMPFIPLLFRSGIVAYNANITTQLVSTPSDIYYNIFDWK